MSNKVSSQMKWMELNKEISEATKAAVKKAAKREERQIKHGWRWIKVGKITQIFVPCDKDGNPTPDGQKRIERLKKNMIAY